MLNGMFNALYFMRGIICTVKGSLSFRLRQHNSFLKIPSRSG